MYRVDANLVQAFIHSFPSMQGCSSRECTLNPWNMLLTGRVAPSAYLPIPVFLLLWLGYKVYCRTSLIPPEKVDLISGKIDEEREPEKEKEGDFAGKRGM